MGIIEGNYNTYIGARYVPIFDGNWDNTKAYEPLMIVQYQGNSYTSKTYVPVGADINDEKYWALTGNYNAQVEQYRQEVLQYENKVDSFDQRITNNENDISNLEKNFQYTLVNVLNPPFGLEPLDNTRTEDNTERLNAIINKLNAELSYKRCILYFPCGTYLINGSINLPAYFCIKGDDRLLTNIHSTANSGIMFTLTGTGQAIENITFGNFGENYENFTFFSCTAIQASFKWLRMYNATLFFDLNNASGTRIFDVYMETNRENATMLSLKGKCVSSKFINVTYYMKTLTGTANTYSGNFCQDLYFNGCEFYSCSHCFIFNGSNTNEPGDIIITDCILDTIVNDAIIINNFNLRGNLIFSNNWLNLTTPTTNKNVFNFNNANNITLSSNKFFLLNNKGSFEVTTIRVVSCKNIIIDSNTFLNGYRCIVANTSDSIIVKGNNFLSPDNANANIAITGTNTTGLLVEGNTCDENYTRLISGVFTQSICIGNYSKAKNNSSFTGEGNIDVNNVYNP